MAILPAENCLARPDVELDLGDSRQTLLTPDNMARLTKITRVIDNKFTLSFPCLRVRGDLWQHEGTKDDDRRRRRRPPARTKRLGNSWAIKGRR